MFKIYDGRLFLYQWDLNRKLIVEDSTITEVHFCNRTGDCSLVCEVYKENTLNVVNIPNILLQSCYRINVYAYDGECTKHSFKLDIMPRTKPADYVYTETEVKNWEEYGERIAALEEGINNIDITNDIKEFAEKNLSQKKIYFYSVENLTNQFCPNPFNNEKVLNLESTKSSGADSNGSFYSLNFKMSLALRLYNSDTGEITEIITSPAEWGNRADNFPTVINTKDLKDLVIKGEDIASSGLVYISELFNSFVDGTTFYNTSNSCNTRLGKISTKYIYFLDYTFSIYSRQEEAIDTIKPELDLLLNSLNSIGLKQETNPIQIIEGEYIGG